MDLVRTRVDYLDALSPNDRKRFVDEALAQVRRREAVVRAESEERRASEDQFGYLGGLGVLYEVRARIRWLEELRRSLDEQVPGGK